MSVVKIQQRKVRQKLKDDVKFGSSDKADWLKNHTLSKEQVRQLILNKYERAKKDQVKLEQLKRLVHFTD